MIRNYDIVCLSTSPWQAPFGSRQELMSRLAEGNRVLFVEYQPSWLHPLRYPRYRRRNGWVPGGLRQLSEHLWVWTPPYGAPWAIRFGLLNRWNQARIAAGLKRVVRQLGFSRILLWVYPPHAAPLLGRLGEELSVYHCIDAFGEESGDRRLRQKIERYECYLAARCDVVIAASQTLADSLRRWRSDCVVVAPGVDIAAFSEAAAGSTPVQEEFSEGRPVVGCVGTFDHRIDIPLLERLASAMPQATLLLVGPIQPGPAFDALAKRPNVRWVGPVPKGEVPAWIRRMHVCLVPYRVTAFTRAIVPLKVFEYLAMGKPVVATMLPELHSLAPAVHIAEDAGAFVETVMGFISADGPPAAARLRLASWEECLQEISNAIEAHAQAFIRREEGVPAGR